MKTPLTARKTSLGSGGCEGQSLRHTPGRRGFRPAAVGHSSCPDPSDTDGPGQAASKERETHVTTNTFSFAAIWETNFKSKTKTLDELDPALIDESKQDLSAQGDRQNL